jgi:tRNA(His) 5'-end guanylyltransferase
MAKTSSTLLSAVSSVTNGTAQEIQDYDKFTVHIEASLVTAGFTHQIQALAPSGTWVAIDSRTIAANGNTVVQFTGAFKQIRAAVTARTDGTVTTTLNARRD